MVNFRLAAWMHPHKKVSKEITTIPTVSAVKPYVNGSQSHLAYFLFFLLIGGCEDHTAT